MPVIWPLQPYLGFQHRAGALLRLSRGRPGLLSHVRGECRVDSVCGLSGPRIRSASSKTDRCSASAASRGRPVRLSHERAGAECLVTKDHPGPKCGTHRPIGARNSASATAWSPRWFTLSDCVPCRQSGRMILAKDPSFSENIPKEMFGLSPEPLSRPVFGHAECYVRRRASCIFRCLRLVRNAAEDLLAVSG